LWKRGKTLKIPPRFERIAKIIGQEYFTKTGMAGKIKILNPHKKI
jgi:hypothetical protein